MKRFNEEHPQLIPDINIKTLKDNRENRKFFDNLIININQKQLICDYNDNPNYPIYYSDRYDRHRFYCLDLENKQIVYYMEYEIQSCDFIKQDWGTQIMVWRGGGEDLTNLTSYILFDILMPDVKVIMTDSVQTSKGKDFWEILIRYSFNKKRQFKVYFIDFHDKSFTEIKNHNDFMDLCDQINPWRDDEFGKGYRFAVSYEELKN